MEFPVGVGKFGRTVISGCRQPGGGVQISAGHEKPQLDKCIAAFIKVGKELGVLK